MDAGYGEEFEGPPRDYAMLSASNRRTGFWGNWTLGCIEGEIQRSVKEYRWRANGGRSGFRTSTFRGISWIWGWICAKSASL